MRLDLDGSLTAASARMRALWWLTLRSELSQEQMVYRIKKRIQPLEKQTKPLHDHSITGLDTLPHLETHES